MAAAAVPAGSRALSYDVGDGVTLTAGGWSHALATHLAAPLHRTVPVNVVQSKIYSAVASAVVDCWPRPEASPDLVPVNKAAPVLAPSL